MASSVNASRGRGTRPRGHRTQHNGSNQLPGANHTQQMGTRPPAPANRATRTAGNDSRRQQPAQTANTRSVRQGHSQQVHLPPQQPPTRDTDSRGANRQAQPQQTDPQQHQTSLPPPHRQPTPASQEQLGTFWLPPPWELFQQAAASAGQAHHQQPDTTSSPAVPSGGTQPQQPPVEPQPSNHATTVPELEEIPSGRGGARRPYHEGGGDKRQRGKRYKAAVQMAYKQRNWVKQDEDNWRDLGPALGLHESDDEEQWARVLARGPRQRRPTAAAAGPTEIDWKQLLNKHLLPREGEQPAPATSTQQQGTPSNSSHIGNETGPRRNQTQPHTTRNPAGRRSSRASQQGSTGPQQQDQPTRPAADGEAQAQQQLPPHRPGNRTGH